MNLIEMLKNELSGPLISSLSQKAGVSEDQVKSGFDAGIPAVLAGILKNGAGAGSGLLDKVLPGANHPDGNPEELLNSNHDSLLEKGKSLVGGLFGEHAGALTDAISTTSGLSADKATGLMAMIVPLITGFVSKIMAGNGWGISDLLGKINESKADIGAALPKGLGDSLGLANIKMPDVNIPKVEVPHVEIPKVDLPKVPPINSGTVEELKPKGGSFRWVLLLLVVLAIIWWVMGKPGCNKPTDNSFAGKADSIGSKMDSAAGGVKAGVAAAATTVAGKMNEAGDFVRDLGTPMSKKLPDGTTINVAENSVENRLITFIEDKTKPADKTTWFSFDRLYFETGKSVLKPESEEQVKNIAAILKAYPNVNIKLGGYTDNSGDPAVNFKISEQRAIAATDELLKQGVDPKRLENQGYGEAHPVAGNNTPEGRAQNRRIDIRVTKK